MRVLMFIQLAVLISTSACTQPQNNSSQNTAVDAETFKAEIDAGKALLVDVRTPQEFASGHIPGSINIDWTGKNYEVEFAKLDPSRPLLLYCAMGGRSDQAREYLVDKGFQVKDLDDGIAAWKKAGYPVER